MPSNLTSQYHRYQRYFVDLGRFYQKKEVAVYTEITLSLLTIAFFGFFALRPTIVTIASLVQELKTKKETDQRLQLKINALAQAQTNFAQVKDSLPLVDNALPSSALIPPFLYQLEILALQNNLSIRSLTIEPQPLIGTISGKNELGFSLSLSGDFGNLDGFITSLETLRRTNNLESFNLTKDKDLEGKLMNLNISGKAYFLPKEEK